MGMFDTINLEKPLICPVCGAENHSLQTHAFDDSMAEYRIGSLLRGSSVLTGIIQETLWCSKCHEAGNSSTSPVYLVIWHSLLAAVEQDLSLAEIRLAKVDRLDLIGWLDEAQRNAQQWRRHYYHLLSDVEKWHEHLAAESKPEAEKELLRKKFLFWGLSDEILASADPLAAIIEKSRAAVKTNDDSTGFGDW